MILNIEGLTAGYKNGPNIVHEVDLSLHEGEIVTIIGPNGAGKSTLLKSIFGITDIRKGQIHHEARDITELQTDQIIRSGIAMVAQGNNVFLDLSVEENLEMGAYVYQNKQEVLNKKSEIIEFFPELKKHLTQKTSILSGGERQMVGIGMALMLSPEVLLLDEPSIGLAPKVVKEVFKKIQSIRDLGTSVLMVEQNAVKALETSDRGYVLEVGRNALEGSASELLDNPKVKELYLGAI